MLDDLEKLIFFFHLFISMLIVKLYARKFFSTQQIVDVVIAALEKDADNKQTLHTTSRV